MAERLTLNRWDEWFDAGSWQDPRLLHTDPSDRILVCPTALGDGYYQNIFLENNVTLVILDFSLGYATRHPITAAMQTILEQILQCPYRGTARRHYLKQKALELVDMRLAAMTRPRLPLDELNHIYQAAAFLRENVTNPPTVETLARHIGTNHLKINQGFHQVYGTTPFGYLKDYRLTQAKHLLISSELSVAQVAAAVGYSSRSRFATAFRQRTGINPKTFQLQTWPYAS